MRNSWQGQLGLMGRGSEWCACWPKVGVLIMCVYVCDGTPQDSYSVANLGKSRLQTHTRTHTHKRRCMHQQRQTQTKSMLILHWYISGDLTDSVTDGKLFHNNWNVACRTFNTQTATPHESRYRQAQTCDMEWNQCYRWCFSKSQETGHRPLWSSCTCWRTLAHFFCGKYWKLSRVADCTVLFLLNLSLLATLGDISLANFI